MAASTPAQPPSPGASTFGDVTQALDVLRGQANELFNEYENDASVYSLAARASEIQLRASQLDDLFNNIGGALQNLGS